MTKVLEEIFFNLIYINGIMAITMISFKLIMNIFISMWNSKKDNETFEKRWEDCD